ncbi:MAG: polysaccharide deacetylase family protein [Bacteroidota bacterium]|nr:polysaccharide deacetylase family protein [Bacteroidota bacterium]
MIFYHDIHASKKYTDMSTSIELFKKHIQIINETGYEIVSEVTNDNGQIEICFDDAFLGLYENIEFLKEQNIPIHLFVISSCLNRENYINEKQLLELNKSDIIKISSHTNTHRILNQLDKNEIEKELKESKKILENLLGAQVDSICYPEGKFNKKTISIAKTVGYKKQYSSLPGFFSEKFGDNVVRRSLVQFAREKEFKAILRGGDHILAFWYKFKHFKR